MARASQLPDETRILQRLRRSRKGPLKAKELAKALKVPAKAYEAFQALLEALETDGKIYLVKGRRYAIPEKINLVVGRLTITRNGDGFVIPDGKERDVFVPEPALDTVQFRPTRRRAGIRCQKRHIRIAAHIAVLLEVMSQ